MPARLLTTGIADPATLAPSRASASAGTFCRHRRAPPNQVLESAAHLPPGVTGNPQKILVLGYALARPAWFPARRRPFGTGFPELLYILQYLNQGRRISYTRFGIPNRLEIVTFQYLCSGLAFGMATEKAETDRVPVTLSLATITYLERLVRQGTHGTSVPGVARTLIEEGIRLAIKDGLLSIRDNGKS
jgi:hypothetical protein